MLRERGNVLFLILIAVALFAALSYAVTQSGRGGGAGVDQEKMELDIAGMMQYVTSVRSEVQRMVINGTAAADVRLTFSSATPNAPCTSGTDCVFAPEGGGIDPQQPPRSIWNNGGALWRYGALNEITGVGTTAKDIVMATGNGSTNICITTAGCEAINNALGVSLPIQTDSVFVGTEIDAYPGEHAACYRPLGGSDCFYFYVVLYPQ